MTNVEKTIERRIEKKFSYLAQVLWDARPAAKNEDDKKSAGRSRSVIKKARKADAERKRKVLEKQHDHIDELLHDQKEAKA